MLISPEAIRLNKELHDRNEKYGANGHFFAEKVKKAIDRLGSMDVLDYGCGKRTLEKALGIPINNYDPAVPGCDKKPKPADLVVCTDVLEHVEPECIDTVLDHLSYLVKKVGYFTVANTPARKTLADGRNAHLLLKPADWWIDKLSSRFEVLSMEYGFGGFEFLVGRGITKKIVCYELLLQPTTFDFAVVAVVAKTLGFDHVRFAYRNKLKPKDYSEEESWARLENIIYPMCDLLGLGHSFGDAEGISLMHTTKQVVGVYKDKGHIAKFVGNPKKSGYVTVTMRESRKPTRNSNREEWNKFIKWCPTPVEVVEDFSVKPISLKDRLDLYAGADMNLMVNNGPAALCYYSDYPILSIKNGLYSNEEKGNLKLHGVDIGFQYPHFNKKQRLVWEDDQFENIKRHYEEMMYGLNG